MKIKILIIGSAMGCALVFADTTDPVGEYKNCKGLTSADTVYRWTADIDGDGKTEVFLSLKEEYLDDKRERQMPSWLVYLAKSSGTSYILSAGVNDGDRLSPGLPGIDPEKVYVGQITQLGKNGIVTIQTDMARSGVGLSRIYAYTVEGDHLKRNLLAEYNPEQSNAIFDQYLKDNVRTHVQLQEVAP